MCVSVFTMHITCSPSLCRLICTVFAATSTPAFVAYKLQQKLTLSLREFYAFVIVK